MSNPQEERRGLEPDLERVAHERDDVARDERRVRAADVLEDKRERERRTTMHHAADARSHAGDGQPEQEESKRSRRVVRYERARRPRKSGASPAFARATTNPSPYLLLISLRFLRFRLVFFVVRALRIESRR